MSDILCIYYTRTGNTGTAMREIGDALGAETVELRDSTDRSGWRGYIRCGLDAVRRTTPVLLPVKTQRPVEEYRLVIVGTPVWAGRCSAVTRSFLKDYGRKLPDTAYVLLRGSENKYEEIYEQMDRFLKKSHVLSASLRSGSVGYHFWKEEFLRQVRVFLNESSSEE